MSNIAILMLWLYFMSFVFVIGLSLNYGEEMEQEKVLNENSPLKVVKERSQTKDTEE